MAHVFVNEHTAEQCAELFEEAQANPWPAALEGVDLPCLCPSGRHLAWFVAETDDPDALLASLPPLYRSGTTIHEYSLAVIGASIPTV